MRRKGTVRNSLQRYCLYGTLSFFFFVSEKQIFADEDRIGELGRRRFQRAKMELGPIAARLTNGKSDFVERRQAALGRL